MTELFSQTVFWHWWVLGAALLLLELMIGTFYLLWMSFAAAVTGLLVAVFPSIEWRAQFLLFGVLSLSSVVVWNRWRARRPEPVSDQPVLNRRGQALTGRTFTLAQPIRDGVGSLRVDDSVWRVQGPDLSTGTRVKVLAVDGATLIVDVA